MPAPLATPNRQQSKKKRNDRRTAVRFLPSQEIVCYCGGSGTNGLEPVRVSDISAGGVCLLVRHPVDLGSEIPVEMINAAHTFLCTRTLRVLRVFKGSTNDAVVAGEFDEKLGYDELLPFIL